MNINETRKKFIEFFKKQNHAVISSSAIVPENDQTTLFTGSGMQPMIPYLLGEKHPQGNRLVNSQKCFRSVDINEVGDNRHTSFFEMLGNWSLGDPASPDGIGEAGYSRESQLPWFFEFLIKEIGLDPKKIYVSVFLGDEKNNLPKDTESANIWKEIFKKSGIDANEVELGSEKNGNNLGMQGGRIFYYDSSKNWWSRAGKPNNMPAGEPGGPDSEVFYKFNAIEHDKKFGKHCHPNCDCGRFLEIGNSVFMEYKKMQDGSFEKLKQKNVDFGGGLERIAAASQDNPDIFNIDVFQTIIEYLEKLSKKSYTDKNYQKSFRIIADHFRAVFFLIADGVIPANTDQGYFARRLIRRSIRHMDLLGIQEGNLHLLVDSLVSYYETFYPEVAIQAQKIKKEITLEEKKFRATLKMGLKEFIKMAVKDISGKDAFMLFSSFGLPIDMIIELAAEKELKVDSMGYEEEFKKHQEISRLGSEKKFKGGLADHSFATTQGHTATHLLLASLRKVLGDHVYQKGSNITAERLRLDFSHSKKMNSEEIKIVEDMVNEQIQKNIPVTWEEMELEKAKNLGAMGVFDEKYEQKVKVYSIGSFSKEICGGPHVSSTGELKSFKILQESASSAGIRRIKAVVGK